jgi:ABC-type glycerol-3-phosphate transport system substrate-binding protein
MGAGWTRRQVLQSTLAASGGLILSGGLGSPAAAAPAVADPILKPYFQINWQAGWNSTAQKFCQEYTDSNLNAQHKGVQAQVINWGNASGVLAQQLANDPTTPWVVSSCCGDFPVALPMLERLDPWLERDNIPRSNWSQGQLLTYQEPDGLYGVPAYTACQPLIYNQDLFDQLGLKYPDPDWDYIEAERIWRSLAGQTPHGQWRYATTIELQPGGFDAYPFMFHGWGQAEGQMDITHSKALFDTPQAIACGTWWYNLGWDKVFINRFNGFGHGWSGAQAMANGAVGMYQSAGYMLYEALAFLRGVRWDVIPMPYWPTGRATNVQVDYYGMNKYAPNKELAWELWKFVNSEATNRFLIKLTFSFPNLMSMWDEWETIVQNTAPVTRTKQIHWWADAAIKGYGFGQQFWKYFDGQAEGLISNVANQIWSHQMDVAEGFSQITKQVNALEASAPAMIASQSWTESMDKVLEHTLFPHPVAFS